MNGLAAVVIAIRAELSGDSIGYLKSRHISENYGLDLTPRQVGARIAYLRERDVPIDIEHWSESGNTKTYKVEIPDKRALDRYVEQISDGEEPTLRE